MLRLKNLMTVETYQKRQTSQRGTNQRRLRQYRFALIPWRPNLLNFRIKWSRRQRNTLTNSRKGWPGSKLRKCTAITTWRITNSSQLSSSCRGSCTKCPSTSFTSPSPVASSTKMANSLLSWLRLTTRQFRRIMAACHTCSKSGH